MANDIQDFRFGAISKINLELDSWTNLELTQLVQQILPLVNKLNNVSVFLQKRSQLSRFFLMLFQKRFFVVLLAEEMDPLQQRQGHGDKSTDTVSV